ncbi:uncharacterized protein K441DRAFT_655402 [Cenococcum geophilum 1.58]|uniref:uncharacterized protein n=1 Tax=Cenococcum geophilum 1.58 TaxID=794803 RepID=UPI00358DE70B|nr:hypothetical protein K441DRAFT_655402 [Cenococcum geophilum 1.58]
MGFHGPISKNAAHSHAWDTVLPSRALSHYKIPHVLWGDFLWAAAFRVPTSCLQSIYFVVPNDRVDAAAKAISTYLPYCKRSPATQLGLPSSSGPADFPDIPVLKYEHFRIGVIPKDLVAFDPTDITRTTTIECDHTSIPVPTLPGLLDSCADVLRIHKPRLPSRLSIMDWFLGRTIADIQREYERKLALCELAALAECYTLLYCFRKKERGYRWTSIKELPEKHRRIAECMRPENCMHFLNNFIDSGKFQFPEDSDDDVEDSGWEDDEDGVLDDYG